jgi:hypothetical protein
MFRQWTLGKLFFRAHVHSSRIKETLGNKFAGYEQGSWLERPASCATGFLVKSVDEAGPRDVIHEPVLTLNIANFEQHGFQVDVPLVKRCSVIVGARWEKCL